MSDYQRVYPQVSDTDWSNSKFDDSPEIVAVAMEQKKTFIDGLPILSMIFPALKLAFSSGIYQYSITTSLWNIPIPMVNLRYLPNNLILSWLVHLTIEIAKDSSTKVANQG